MYIFFYCYCFWTVDKIHKFYLVKVFPQTQQSDLYRLICYRIKHWFILFIHIYMYKNTNVFIHTCEQALKRKGRKIAKPERISMMAKRQIQFFVPIFLPRTTDNWPIMYTKALETDQSTENFWGWRIKNKVPKENSEAACSL